MPSRTTFTRVAGAFLGAVAIQNNDTNTFAAARALRSGGAGPAEDPSRNNKVMELVTKMTAREREFLRAGKLKGVKPPGEETPGKEETPPPVDVHVQTMAGETLPVPAVVSIGDVRAALEANLGHVDLFQPGNEDALANDVKLADMGAPSGSPLVLYAVPSWPVKAWLSNDGIDQLTVEAWRGAVDGITTVTVTTNETWCHHYERDVASVVVADPAEAFKYFAGQVEIPDCFGVEKWGIGRCVLKNTGCSTCSYSECAGCAGMRVRFPDARVIRTSPTWPDLTEEDAERYADWLRTIGIEVLSRGSWFSRRNGISYHDQTINVPAFRFYKGAGFTKMPTDAPAWLVPFRCSSTTAPGESFDEKEWKRSSAEMLSQAAEDHALQK